MSQPAGRRRKLLGSGPSRGLVAGAVVVVLAIGLYLAGFLFTGDRVPRDVTVAGVSIGGLPRDQAIAELERALQPRLSGDIPVTVEGEPATIDARDTGITVDYAATVEKAGVGQSLDPRRIWAVLSGGGEVEPVQVVDDRKLDRLVEGLARRFGREPVDAAITVDGKQFSSEPMTTGREVDRARTSELLLSRLLQPGAIAIPVRDIAPEITDAEVEQLISRRLEPAVAAPITVETGGHGTFTITRSMIADALLLGRNDGKPTATLDGIELRSAADRAIKRGLQVKDPQDATVRLADGRPKVVPAVPGATVAADDLARAAGRVLTEPEGRRTTTVKLSPLQPDVTTADAKQWGVEEVTGSFTTYFPYAEYRNHNIGRAAEILNGTVVMPGELFSFNETVGERTVENGFVAGTIISGGIFKEDLGGGVSQSVTTTYNAAFFAGMKDVEHHPHSLYIDRYPAGREATVAWPTLDLKFRNTTDYAVLIQAYVNEAEPGGEGSVTVKMWSTKTYDKIVSTEPEKSDFTYGQDITSSDPNCVPSSPVQGFDVSYSRLYFNDGKQVKKEDFFWRYDPTNRVTCV